MPAHLHCSLVNRKKGKGAHSLNWQGERRKLMKKPDIGCLGRHPRVPADATGFQGFIESRAHRGNAT